MQDFDSTPEIYEPQFPRGFVLSTGPIEAPAGFVPGPVLPNFFLHPWCDVDSTRDRRGRFVVVVGLCVPTVETWVEEPPSTTLLRSLRRGEGALLEELDDYCGRYAVIYGSKRSINVVSDATAMRSVFYAKDRQVVASHALLVERALGGLLEFDEMPFRFGFPGNRVPYKRVRILTANTLYDLDRCQVRRYWPRKALPDQTVGSAANEVLGYAVAALTRVAARRPVKLALTAGLDSRCLLAVALKSGIRFQTYTYGSGRDTLVDRQLAPDLAAKVGVPHTVIPTNPPSQGLAECLAEAHYTIHHQGAVEPLMKWVGDYRAVAVTANLLEIGRSFYRRARDGGIAEPTTPEGMYALHFRVTPRSGKERIREWGEERYKAASMAAFDEMIAMTQYDAARGVLDPFDQFYWEHRMSAWHGASMVERDFYAEPFIPFNSRRVFESFLAVSRPNRDSGAVFRELIRAVDPGLLDLPINPPTWPPQLEAQDAVGHETANGKGSVDFTAS